MTNVAVLLPAYNEEVAIASMILLFYMWIAYDKEYITYKYEVVCKKITTPNKDLSKLFKSIS